MKVAIPLFGTRVSPRCLFSDKTRLFQVTNGRVVSEKTVDTSDMTEEERLSQLVDLEIDVFICGAIDDEFIQRAGSYGIKVFHDVAAEAEDAVSALIAGTLKNGYGLANGIDDILSQSKKTSPEAAPEETEREAVSGHIVDCVECMDRVCLRGENCLSEFRDIFPIERYSRLQHSMEVTMDVAAEPDRKLCRVAELIYYCIGMEYKHIGVAFCVEMFREAEILTRLLKRFFRVSPVCCKIGGKSQRDLLTSMKGVLCNPIGQARVLNSLKTDINVVMGLCVGVDFIFAQHSEAPTSTLFVKDKSLANNPVSALYSKYYIDDILREL